MAETSWCEFCDAQITREHNAARWRARRTGTVHCPRSPDGKHHPT